MNEDDHSDNSQSTILKGIIKDSLVAFPSAAHQHVLNYLTDAGIDEASSLKFRQAWSKVVLGSEAFGRSSSRRINPDMFSDELIQDLSSNDEIVARIMNAAEACIKLDSNSKLVNLGKQPLQQQERNPQDIAASLDAVSSLGLSLSRSLTDIYLSSKKATDPDHDDEAHLFESVGQLRKSLRGTRMAWSNIDNIVGDSRDNTTGSYSPLDDVNHGYPDVIRGSLDMQLRTDRHDLNVFMSTSDLIGVIVSHKQPIHQERGWNAYLCLNELTSSNNSNIFPLPVGVNRNAATLSTTFGFEGTGSQSLSTLRSPALSTFLRRHPVVVHAWCVQLSVAARKLMNCSGSLMKAISITQDVHVRDNGLLLIGNVAFDSVNPHTKPRYRRNFLEVGCNILACALNLSRTERVTLREYDEVNETSMILDEEEQRKLDDDTALSVPLSTNRFSQPGTSKIDIVMPVVVGSKLDIFFGGHTCSSVKVHDNLLEESKNQEGNGNAKLPMRTSNIGGSRFQQSHEITASTLSTLVLNLSARGSHRKYIRVEADSNRRKLITKQQPKSSVYAKVGEDLKVTVHAIRSGIVSINATALVAVEESKSQTSINGSNDAVGRYVRKECTIQVVVVPDYPVESVLLQDLIGHLEQCSEHKDPEIILNSQLFHTMVRKERHPTTDGRNDNVEEPESKHLAECELGVINLTNVQKGWQDIQRSLANYGTVNLTNFDNLRQNHD